MTRDRVLVSLNATEIAMSIPASRQLKICTRSIVYSLPELNKLMRNISVATEEPTRVVPSQR